MIVGCIANCKLQTVFTRSSFSEGGLRIINVAQRRQERKVPTRTVFQYVKVSQ
jgi:hypothetical protein